MMPSDSEHVLGSSKDIKGLEVRTFAESWRLEPVYLVINSQPTSRFCNMGNDYLTEQSKVLSIWEMPWSLSVRNNVT